MQKYLVQGFITYNVHTVIYVIYVNIYTEEFTVGPDFKCIVLAHSLRPLYLVSETGLNLLQDFAKFCQTARRQLAVENPI